MLDPSPLSEWGKGLSSTPQWRSCWAKTRERALGNERELLCTSVLQLYVRDTNEPCIAGLCARGGGGGGGAKKACCARRRALLSFF